MAIKLIKESAVKAFVKERGRTINHEVIEMIDFKTELLLTALCSTHNGGKKQIDMTTASIVSPSLIKTKKQMQNGVEKRVH